MAGRIKKELRMLGLSAFLAHEDLLVSSQWRREILRRLDTCVALVAIITESFYESDWTSQEVGVAIGKEKTIISLVLKKGVEPRGFMESFQYIRSSEKLLEDALGQLAKVLDAAKLSSETREAYENLAGILDLLLLTWENRAGYRRNPQAVSEIKDRFGTYSEMLSESISLYEEHIDPKIARSFKTLMKAAGEYLRLYPDDFDGLEDVGERVFRRGTKLMNWLRDRLPRMWQKAYLSSTHE